MTERKATFRGRRATAAGQIPKNIAEWFAGVRRFTFYAYTPPHCSFLRAYWQAWKVQHPDALPPDGFEVAAVCGEKQRLAKSNSAER